MDFIINETGERKELRYIDAQTGVDCIGDIIGNSGAIGDYIKEEIKMRKYYVHYYMDFANTYNLYYTEGDFEVPDTWDRITRKEAERLARAERRREIDDPAFSGRASNTILPADYPGDGDIVNDRRYVLRGYIWEHV